MNEKMLKTSVIAGAMLLAGLPMAPQISYAGDDFAAAWDAADAKRKEAAAVGYEWRDTGKTLKKAKTEAEAGNMEKAMKLVAKALEEANDAIVQEARESKLWGRQGAAIKIDARACG